MFKKEFPSQNILFINRTIKQHHEQVQRGVFIVQMNKELFHVTMYRFTWLLTGTAQGNHPLYLLITYNLTSHSPSSKSDQLDSLISIGFNCSFAVADTKNIKTTQRNCHIPLLAAMMNAEQSLSKEHEKRKDYGSVRYFVA